MTSLDFLKALSVLIFLISLTNWELKILTPSRTSIILINLKIPFLSKLFISLYQDFVNSGVVYLEVVVLGFVGVSLMDINISVVFCWSLVGSCYVCFNLW